MFPRDPADRAFRRYCRSGDPETLAEVFDRTARELLRVAVWLSGNRADAEDLLQRTFLSAIEGRDRFDPAQRRTGRPLRSSPPPVPCSSSRVR
jgi:DNA-directed RNA polymerase specialized sigma24 family protein